jgi:hypothetical protein
MVVNVCNPNYSNGRDQEITVWDQPGQKVSKTLSQPTILCL